jgi:signal transduction histidine kinase
VKPLNWRLLAHQLSYVLRASRQEAQLRDAHDRAARADAFKDNLLRVVRHEFNTPFNAILGFGKLIEAHAPDGASRNHAAHILTAANGLKAVLDRMHLASRAAAGELDLTASTFGVTDLVRTAIQRVVSSREVAGSIGIVDRTGNIEVSGDWRMLVIALGGVVQNALEHGRTPISVIVHLPGNGQVEISVRDRGSGLSEQAIAAVMAPFVQGAGALTRASEGLGLGLSLASAMAQVHGGSVRLRNLPGGGLEASIRIALRAPFSAAVDEEDAGMAAG